jgi:uncharacterized RDD family membrane protein YckC
MDQSQRDRPYLAEWWPRVGATLLDIVVVWAIWFVALIAVALVTLPLGIADDLGGGLWTILYLVLAVLYSCGTMSRKGRYNGQTLGKQAAGIRVVRDNGTPMTFGPAFVRDVLLKWVGGTVTLGIGWIIDSLWPLGERENRALHDLIVKTHVVEDKVRQPQLQSVPQPAQALPQLAPPIARHYDAARRIQGAIGAAVQNAQLPYGQVSREIDDLMRQLWQSALRANMLHEALEETPVARVEQRLAELQFQKSPELIGALKEQLIVQRRMQGQLERYDAEMERIVVELDTVRANIVSVSATGDIGNQERLADTVRELRDEMSAVGEGMDQAYGR